MAANSTGRFLAGVIEGFYGKPWTREERRILLQWMGQWGLNTYLYAPKDDLKHRTIWRASYSAAEAEKLGNWIRACSEQGIRFVYALSPGLDIRYSRSGEVERIQARFEQLLGLGCDSFALLFDDIPDCLDAEDLGRWGSLAGAQCQVANTVLRWVRQRAPEGRFLFCPTPYCGRMAERKLGGEGYLGTVGRELAPEIDVFWTGPEIVSREISVAHVRQLQAVLRRKPLIWDNLHANDYDGRRAYVGPYAGRPLELRGEVAGLLLNPNNELPLNHVPVRTLAAFVKCEGTRDPRRAYEMAMADWVAGSRGFEPRRSIRHQDLLLLGDCYYLPHEDGLLAEALYRRIRALLANDPATWRAAEVEEVLQEMGRLRDACARVADLRERGVFYAWSRRVWELREELDLVMGWVRQKAQPGGAEAVCRSDFHLPLTYRGGFVPRLQALLVQGPEGEFRAAERPAGAG
jgi:protein O-GlcNAcase/histone acetyltransferase